ncbi:MAG: hypothetical protein FWC50_01900 [Planctomycetaceae bacterium]|nr:hypothetical protein [Planctomycetaceae bacterium]
MKCKFYLSAVLSRYCLHDLTDDAILSEVSAFAFCAIFSMKTIPQSVWAAAFGLAQPPCVAGLPYSASEIFHRFEYISPFQFRVY